MKIGFIGLGVMGRLMGQRLMQNGYQLVVRDANPAAEASFAALGAEVAGSAREVADRAEIVLCSLPTPAVVREVFIGAEGLVHGQAMRIAVDLSTTGMQVAREIATAFAPAGKTLVDAPVSGGVLGAEAGTLSVMTSGGARPAPRSSLCCASSARTFSTSAQMQALDKP